MNRGLISVLVFVCLLILAVGLIIFIPRHPRVVAVSPPVRIVDVDPIDDDTDFDYLPPPANHPPAFIKVGVYHWRVRYVAFPDYYGITDPIHLEILLDPRLPLDKLKETLVHELIHACLEIGNGSHSKLVTDDVFIESTAPTFLEVLETNPRLVKWLTQKNF